jgi:hypothetical protein
MEEISVASGGLFGSLKDLLVAHWSFLIVAIVLGTIGNFAKTRVWTKARAISGNPLWLWWWGRASLPLHAPFAGVVVGLILSLTLGTQAPAGPGIETLGERCLYYMGSGVFSSWVFVIFKHFMESKGIKLEEVHMPGDDAPASRS